MKLGHGIAILLAASSLWGCGSILFDHKSNRHKEAPPAVAPVEQLPASKRTVYYYGDDSSTETLATFDAKGRPLSERAVGRTPGKPDRVTEKTYRYTPRGEPDGYESVTKVNGAVVATSSQIIERDERGLKLRERTEGREPGQTEPTSYSEARYTYDDKAWLIAQETAWKANGNEQTGKRRLTHDASGRITAVDYTLSNGHHSVTRCAFDGDGRLVQQSYESGAAQSTLVLDWAKKTASVTYPGLDNKDQYQYYDLEVVPSAPTTATSCGFGFDVRTKAHPAFPDLEGSSLAWLDDRGTLLSHDETPDTFNGITTSTGYEHLKECEAQWFIWNCRLSGQPAGPGRNRMLEYRYDGLYRAVKVKDAFVEIKWSLTARSPEDAGAAEMNGKVLFNGQGKQTSFKTWGDDEAKPSQEVETTYDASQLSPVKRIRKSSGKIVQEEEWVY